jgi:hypothetical protein
MDIFFVAPVNSSVSSSLPNHHTKVKFDPDLRVLIHKSFSFHKFEDKTESFQCVDVFSRYGINQLVKVLLLEVQKYFLWDEQKCLSSPFYCIAKYLSAVDFNAKFQHVLQIPVYSEEFRSVSEEILNMKPISYRRVRFMVFRSKETEPVEEISHIGSYALSIVPNRHRTALVCVHDIVAAGHVVTFTHHEAIISDLGSAYTLRVPRIPDSRAPSPARTPHRPPRRPPPSPRTGTLC